MQLKIKKIRIQYFELGSTNKLMIIYNSHSYYGQAHTIKGEGTCPRDREKGRKIKAFGVLHRILKVFMAYQAFT